jgi:hypothetical protein
MLLAPESFAPSRQYHADVDLSDDNLEPVDPRDPARGYRSRPIPDDVDLGEVYRGHRPIDAPITTPPDERHHPMA